MNYHSRYAIIKEGLFKNTKKILSVFHNSFTLENVDGSEKETISFEEIKSIQYSSKNQKEFKIKYQTQKNNDTLLTFTCSYRLNLISDLQTQIDLYSKINQYPLEMFKCYISYNLIDMNKDALSFEEKDKRILVKNNTNKIVYDINLNLYRSIFEWIPIDSKKEMRIYFYDIESLKRIIIKGVNALLISTMSKIKLVLIPKNQDEYMTIVDKIIENSSEFLGYTIPFSNDIDTMNNIEEENTNKEMKTIFSFSNIHRILFNEIKIDITMTCDNISLYEINNGKVISTIPLSSIMFVILYETNENYFELILNDNSRLIYEAIPEMKNTIVTTIIESLQGIESYFFILPSKPKLGKRIRGFPQNISDFEFETKLIKLFLASDSNDILRNVIEELCVNDCFRESTPQQRDTIFDTTNKKRIFSKIYTEMKKSIQEIKAKKEEDNKKWTELYKLNLMLLVCKNIGWEIYSNEFKDILIACLDELEFVSVFYNSVMIIREFLMTKGIRNKKEELTFKNEIITNVTTTGFFKKFAVKKIFIDNIQSNKRLFEMKNILYLTSILNLQIKILEISTNYQLFQDVISNLTNFDALFLFYKLIRCESPLLVQKSIQILVNIIQNLSIEQESQLKSKILNSTILFFAVLLIYLKNKSPSTTSLSLIFLKSILILHVECTNLVLNLFPLTLFYHIQNKPKPINWLGPEWDKFFSSLLKDYSQIKLIWNQTIRNELIDNLENLIANYEQFTENNNVVLSFAENLDAGDTSLSIENISSNKDIISNVSYFFLNYKEIKIEYKTLKKEAFVWQYYLRKIINEKGIPNLYCTIENPKKFWKKLKREILGTSSEHHIILIIKTMILLYKNYYESIGVFKEYEFFIKFYKSISSFDIKCYVIQLFLTTIKLNNKEVKEQNIKQLIELKGIDCFIKFVTEVCNSDSMKSTKELSYDIITAESIEVSSSFIDNKKNVIVNDVDEDILYDEKFPNYCEYKSIDDSSYKNASKEIKIITLVSYFYKLLLKRNPILVFSSQDSIDNFKIAFPMPKMKAMFFDENNYKIILSLLLYKNENLTQEILDFIIEYLDDPLTYFSVTNKYCTVDILFMYMLIYKSKILFDLLHKMNNYHRLFFSFSFLNLSNEEKEFFDAYPQANKFLIRYFPINIIYYIETHSFNDLIDMLYSNEIKNQSLIWNRDMLTTMLQCIKQNIEKNQLKFDSTFKCNYYGNTYIEEKGCYLYYVNLINDVTSLEQSHFNSLTKILNEKINNSVHIDIDIGYVNILYRILKKFSLNVNQENKDNIYNTCAMKYKAILDDNGSDDVNKSILFLYMIKILILLNENNAHDLSPLILTGAKCILETDIKTQSHYEKCLIRIINYMYKKQCYNNDKAMTTLICKYISKQLLFRLDSLKLVNSYMNLFLSISLSDNRALFLDTALPYQFIIICTLYKETKETTSVYNKNGSLYQISFKILKSLCKEKSFASKMKVLIGDELYKQFNQCDSNSNAFLVFFKNEHKTPVFIWNRKLVNELILFLNSIIEDINQGIFDENAISTFKYKTYEKELKIKGIYLSIYNQFPTFQIDNAADFITELIATLKKEEISPKAKNEILFAISNVIEYAKEEVFFDNEFFNVFYSFANDKESSSFIIINFIYVLTLAKSTINIVLDTKTTFCLINLIEREDSKPSFDKLNKLITSLYKKNFFDKINLTVFLFLLKKIMNLRSIKTNKEEVTQIRKNILSLICLYSNNTSIGKGLSSLYEIYLPRKIIDNLFHLKDVNEHSLTKWLDTDLELPDLIWNKAALCQSYKLLSDDCQFIISDINNLDNFPTNFLNHKLSKGSRMNFFFEINDEFKIDNIYLRLFNKEPNYNIGKNMINFIIDIIDDWINNLENFTIFILTEQNEKEIEYLHRRIITEMTSMMLTIEQINFNDFNNNLCIANQKEMINVISNHEEYQNNLIPLIQRSFDYQKMLNEDICKKILQMQSIFFSLNKDTTIKQIDNSIRLAYLQTIYLIFLNKHRCSLFIEKFEISIIDYYISNIDIVSDYELIVLICIFNRLVGKDISYINTFLTKYLDSFIMIAQKRKHVIKYIEMLLSRILNDSQYGESLSNIMKQKSELFNTVFSNNLNQKYALYENKLFPIWRKASDYDQSSSIYKINSYYDDKEINENFEDTKKKNKGGIYYKMFPIITKKAVEYYSYEDVNLDEKREKILSDENIIKSNKLKKLIDFFNEIRGENQSSESNTSNINNNDNNK